jgi:hypothetical protein
VTGLRECPCCRRPIWPTFLACDEHWHMLPAPLRNSIAILHREGMMDSYYALVSVAHRYWMMKGVLNPGGMKNV